MFSALVLTLNPGVTITYGRRVPVLLSVASTQTFSYDEARR